MKKGGAEPLSARQLEVLALLAQGLANRDIASVLFVSVDTVRSHVSAILNALHVSNRTEAASIFFEQHAKTPDPVRRVLAEPAIAVLPLVALDPRPKVTLAAAGITRDLVSLFSRCSWFPVISLIDAGPKESGRSSGARFIVSGALRTAGKKFRLDLQVTDTTTDQMIWTDARDFPVRALFEVQDEVTAEIVARAYARLVAAVTVGLQTRSVHPRESTTWQLAHAAFDHHRRREQSGHVAAKEGFRSALEREPKFVLAHFGLGLTAYDTILNQWGPARAASRELHHHAHRCLELAPHMAEGHFLEGRRWITVRDYARAVATLESAIGVNPSFAAAHALLAQVHTIEGRLDEGLARIRIAARLGPRAYTAGLAVVHFARHEWRDALAASEDVVAVASDYPFGRALAAASAYWLGDEPLAATHARVLFRNDASFAVDKFRKTFGSQVDLVVKMSEALEALR